jgi:hypothetical protein
MDVVDDDDGMVELSLRIVWSTEKAWLLSEHDIPSDDQKFWVSKTSVQCIKTYIHKTHSYGDFLFPKWLAEKEGLI